ncbi:MAG TPA: prephenate dehydrogenase [Actinomycetes bacterium]|nr:prephenate dehydrogenase [Actinomycetes bacterium]
MSPTVHIVGAGLLGTSLGLALRRSGWAVSLSDRDPAAQRLAADLGAGTLGWPASTPDLVVIAVPPSAFEAVAAEIGRLGLDATVTDLCSVKSVIAEAIERVGLADRFVGGHPMAGRERSGPHGAQADLFDGRPWVLCPTSSVSVERVNTVTEMVTECGAQPVQMTAAAHDAAVARVSHAPQVVASLLAAQLVDADPQQLELAGQGVRDTVRIAASDSSLWSQILAANAGPVADVLTGLDSELQGMIALLRKIESAASKSDKSINQETDSSLVTRAVEESLERGRAGHGLIPGKHGAPAVAYEVVPVVIPDEPGALARLFVAAGEAGVNIEDISIEHSPGQPVGLVELSVVPGVSPDLIRALTGLGWSVH